MEEDFSKATLSFRRRFRELGGDDIEHPLLEVSQFGSFAEGFIHKSTVERTAKAIPTASAIYLKHARRLGKKRYFRPSKSVDS